MTNLTERRFRWWLAAIWLMAFALRMAIRSAAGTTHYWTDGYGLYMNLVESMAEGRGYAFAGHEPSAYRVPLYPLFIWAVTGGHRAVWALITAQAAVSAGTAVIAGLIAGRLAGPLAGLGAATLYALWPYGAWHDVSLQESGLFAFLAALATWALIIARARPRAGPVLAAGALLGLAVLTRSTLLPFALGAVVWLALPGRNNQDVSPRRRFVGAALGLLAFAVVLAPWLERAHRITGAYVLGTESGGFLYAANHPLTFSAFPRRSMDESRAQIYAARSAQDMADLAKLDVTGQDRWYRDKGLAAIKADPARFVTSAARKLWAAFGVWPAPRHTLRSDLAYAATWVPFFGLGLIGMVLRRKTWRKDGLLWWHFATFTGATAVFWAQTAHRSYLDPYIAVFGGITLARICAAGARIRAKAS